MAKQGKQAPSRACRSYKMLSSSSYLTPHVEGYQIVLWHMSHHHAGEVYRGGAVQHQEQAGVRQGAEARDDARRHEQHLRRSGAAGIEHTLLHVTHHAAVFLPTCSVRLNWRSRLSTPKPDSFLNPKLTMKLRSVKYDGHAGGWCSDTEAMMGMYLDAYVGSSRLSERPAQSGYEVGSQEPCNMESLESPHSLH